MELNEIKKNKFWAGAILFNPVNNQILLQKRDAIAPVNPSKWAFFGGVGENGETPEDCLIRELKEELGATIQRDNIKPVRDYLNEKLMTWRYIFLIKFDLEKSQMTLGEGEDFDWVPLSEALGYDLTDNTKWDVEFFLQKV